jgi:hypothetical protein
MGIMMRRSYLALLAVAATVHGAMLVSAEETLDLPLRKAGLWEVRTQTDEGKGMRSQDLTMCIGDAMERTAVRTSGAENRANCAKYDVKKTPEGTTVDALCTYDDRKVTSRTELHGDFTTVFKVKVESTTSGNAPRAQGGQPVNVHRIILQEGKYLGESCGGLQAGEAKTAAGATVTVQ